jgi:ribosomal-protein-serine acetyltransferase
VSPLPVDLGDGVVLRRYTPGDAEALFAAVDAERERLSEWLPWVELMDSVEHERRWVESSLADERSLMATGIFEGEELAGGAGLSVDPIGVVGEIGYWIRKPYEGRGLVNKATSALIDIGFDEVGLHRICVRAAPQNLRSRAIPERLGFTIEGVHREEGRGSRGFHDLIVYGLLEDEWRRRRSLATP